MNLRIAIKPRWFGQIPTKGGEPVPRNQWARAGRRRRWSVRWFAPNGTRHRKTFTAESDARMFARKLTADGESRGPQARIRPKRISLGAFADELKTLGVGPRGEKLAPRSVHEYNAVLDRFVEFVGRRVLLEEATLGDVQRYLAHLRETPSRRNKPLSTASLNKHKRSLKAVFNIAVRQLGYLNFNPLDGLRQDKLGQKTLRYVAPVEFNKLIEAARRLPNRAAWWETYLHLAYTCGARSGELMNLWWSDLDFEHDSVTICAKNEADGVEAWRPKDYDSRTIPLPRATMQVLATWHSKAKEGATFVFISPRRAAWIRQQREAGTWKVARSPLNNLTRDFGMLVRSAGIAHASLHDLRRACISHWARKLPAALVQKLAGHSNIATTMRYYVSVRQEDLDAARDVTAAVLAPTPEVAA